MVMHVLVYRNTVSTPLILTTKVITFASWIILAAIVISGPEIAAIISGAFMTFNTLLMVYFERKHNRSEERREDEIEKRVHDMEEGESHKSHTEPSLQQHRPENKHSNRPSSYKYDHLRKG